MKTEQLKNIQDLKVGDIIRGKFSEITYVVTRVYGTRAIAVRTVDIKIPEEWEIIKQ